MMRSFLISDHSGISSGASSARRDGSIIVLSAFLLSLALTFVCLSVDLSYVSLTRTKMQNACDAAALAAAMEITESVRTAGPDVTNVTDYAIQAARAKAAEVAALNGVYVDPVTDVDFGRYSVNPDTGKGATDWNVTPANCVRVTARRDNPNPGEPDSRLSLFFAPVLGQKSTAVTTSAAAYVESRDIALVLDYSASMNDDSAYDNVAGMTAAQRASLDANMQEIYEILASVRNLGAMTFQPQWLRVTATSGDRSATVEFRNTQAVVTANAAMTQVVLTFDDNSTQTIATTATSGTFQRSGTAKRITQVAVSVTNPPGDPPPFDLVTSSTSGSGGRSASVTFDINNNTAVARRTSSSSSHNIQRVRVYYYGSSSYVETTVSPSAQVVNLAGNGTYMYRVDLRLGSSTWLTIYNPYGNSPPTPPEPTPVPPTVITVQDNNTNVKSMLGLTNVAYPWGSGSWDEFINYCRTDSTINSAGHRYKYGGACLVNYLLRSKPAFTQCNDLWRTPHYPFHSVKQGALLFIDFLQNLGFGDEVGAVQYATNYNIEQTLDYDGFNINLSSDPVSNRFADLKQILRHRQAAHYTSTTNIGGGIKSARQMLETSSRSGSRPTMLIMTDGVPTAMDSGWTFPSNWDWNDLFDYNGDGVRDYYTTDKYAQYALLQAKVAVDAGYTIHTLTVGSEGDPALMAAIAWLGKGITIVVPGDQSVAAMEAQVLEAFNRIAAFVPPAKLVAPE